MTDSQALLEEAERRGVSTSYYDIFGQHHPIQPNVLRYILDSIGPEVPQYPLPPTLVLTAGEERELPAPATLHMEDGTTREITRIDGNLPLGYHELQLHDRSPAIFLIICPARMWTPSSPQRRAGLAISLYGLRSSLNWGAGDLRDLRQLIRWATEKMGLSFIALNPLHALHNRIPYNASPYLPLCSYYRNFLYLDVENIPEFQSAEIQEEFRKQGIQDELAELRNTEYVEYERVAHIKDKFLRKCFQLWLKNGVGDLESYIQQQGKLLRNFALYCVLDKHFRETAPGTWLWTQWPKEFQSPDTQECQKFLQIHEQDVQFYCWIQMQLDRQLKEIQKEALDLGMDIGLYHDLALATDRFGCDLWANREYYIEGCRVGAPPDDFSPNGQDWAFPPGNSSQQFRDGYRLFIASVRHNASNGGALRLDHVMRLFRLFWIPDGFSAKDGTYVYERWRDLFGILALESHRLKVRIIGEDLGTITDEMRQGLMDYGVLGYRLLYFEREHDGQFREPQHYTPAAVASTTTHDLPTLSGFWQAQDVEARRNAGLLPDDESYYRQLSDRFQDKQKILDRLHSLHLLPDNFPSNAQEIGYLTTEMRDAILNMLSSTPCELFVMNQEDLTFETLQQNLPGSTAEYPNWRRKMRYSLEELDSREDFQEMWIKIRTLLERTGRLRER